MFGINGSLGPLLCLKLMSAFFPASGGYKLPEQEDLLRDNHVGGAPRGSDCAFSILSKANIVKSKHDSVPLQIECLTIVTVAQL